MLAREPPETGKQPPRVDGWEGVIFPHLEAGLEADRSWRWSWLVHWMRLAAVYLPYRLKWVVTPNTMNRGSPVNDEIIDNTPVRANQICGAGLLNGLMSRSRPWFRFSAALPGAELDTAARTWLDDAADRVLAVLAGSNFYTAAGVLCEDVSAFGTSPMIVYEDHEDVIRCYVPVPGEYFLRAGGRLSVDGFSREFTYTAEQIVDFFGLDNCPEEVRHAWQQGGASRRMEWVVAHTIEPNYQLAGAAGKPAVSPVPGTFSYREVYWLRHTPTPAPLSIRGFLDRPFFALRWSATSNDPYGRGPGMNALGDATQLQFEQSRKGEFIDKGVRPSMGASPAMENRASTIIAGGVTYVHGADGNKNSGFWPLYMPEAAWFGPLSADIEQVQQRVKEAFFEDVWLAITQMEGVQPRTEMELSQRLAEKVQRLGPVIDLFEDEFASPAIQRVVDIMRRFNMFAPMPPSLRRLGVKIEYTSMLRTMQRAAETATMERGMTVLGNIGAAAQAAGQPNPLRIVNLDKSARIYLDRIGFPAAGLYSEAEVETADRAKMQQAHEAQLMQAIPQTAQAAESLSNVDVGGGMNAVQALLGSQPGAPPGTGAPARQP